MGICMPHVEGVLSLLARFWFVVLVGCIIGCSSPYDQMFRPLLHMWLYSPTEYREVDEALSLIVSDRDITMWTKHTG